MENNSNDKIQIVAFSTNDTYETPNDFVNIFLEKTVHSLIKKIRHSIGFSIMLPEETTASKVMICSILNLKRDYTGLNDVNCYLLFVDLEKEDSKDKIEDILNYMKTYCNESKKIFVFGLSIGDGKVTQSITQKDICGKFNSQGTKFEFKCLNNDKKKEISEYFSQILVYCNKHQRSGEDCNNDEEMKDDANSGSCVVFSLLLCFI